MTVGLWVSLDKRSSFRRKKKEKTLYAAAISVDKASHGNPSEDHGEFWSE